MGPEWTKEIERPSLVDTVKWMTAFANKGKKDLEIRHLVANIVKDVASGDYASECNAIYHWVDRNIRYLRDIHNVEFVQEPKELLRVGAGDCDDMATLLAAMFMAAGNRCEFVLVGFSSDRIPSHVFVRVVNPQGKFVFDPVANRDTKKMLESVTHVWVEPCEESRFPVKV